MIFFELFCKSLCNLAVGKVGRKRKNNALSQSILHYRLELSLNS